jgi:5'-methylthioinosine phosphorylase
VAEHAVIGGTGLTNLSSLALTGRREVTTPYGEPSGALLEGRLAGVEVIFLARHGQGHRLPPHKINYRANLWALREEGVKNVIAINAVGGIPETLGPGRLAIPDQLIDYTWSRQHTYFDGDDGDVVHIDFSEPYSANVREVLCAASEAAGVNAASKAVYGITQGPRLETPAEIDRLERDGCDLVGMTGMPEAALARELSLNYAACAVVANYAAGRGDGGEITMDDIRSNLERGMESVRQLLALSVTMM